MSASAPSSASASLAAEGACELVVSGITCMDCALKFEEAVRELPGVTAARLNATTGLLRVEGACDIDAIRTLGRIERYLISHRGEHQGGANEPGRLHERGLSSELNKERARAAVALAAVVLGYVLPLLGGAEGAVIGAFLLATLVGGWSNFRKAALSIPRMDLNMAVLMSIAVVGAVAIGEFEEAGVVALLFSLSALLEGWTHDRARRSISELMDMAPKTAMVQRGDSLTEVGVDDLIVGDTVVVRPGEKMPIDGTVLSGSSSVVQSAITGESIPVDRSEGDPVFAGSLNGHGALTIAVTRLVEDTAIAQMIHLVEEAQATKTPAQQFVERFARVYTPAVIALAVAIAIGPPLIVGASWTDWFYRALTLLVVSCPCALVVSTPVATVSAIATAARNGVLIKGGAYLEQLGATRAIVFDKTGTLTMGEPRIVQVTPFLSAGGDCSYRPDEHGSVLELAAAVEQYSEHPIARAVMAEATLRNLQVPGATSFQALVGVGATAQVGTATVTVQSARTALSLSSSAADEVQRMSELGATVLVVERNGFPIGAIAVADTVRPETRGVVSSLRESGIEYIGMLTGDSEIVAASIARDVGINQVEHSLMPSEKLEAVRKLGVEYGAVAMVGDGINDAPALAAADVGIAMGGAGSDTALETADVVLMGDSVGGIPYAVELSKATMRIIRQNISFAIGIKALALIAVYPGWLTLWLAILADMGAAVIVTLNGLRLLGFRKGS